MLLPYHVQCKLYTISKLLLRIDWNVEHLAMRSFWNSLQCCFCCATRSHIKSEFFNYNFCMRCRAAIFCSSFFLIWIVIARGCSVFCVSQKSSIYYIVLIMKIRCCCCCLSKEEQLKRWIFSLSFVSYLRRMIYHCCLQ